MTADLSAREGVQRMRPRLRGRLSRALRLLLRDPDLFWRKARRVLRPMPEPYRSRFSMTLGEWLVYHQTHVVFDHCHWMGVPTVKNPLDAWIYQELLFEQRPERLLEIGSAAGGSTLYFAHLMDLLGAGMVVSVDINRSAYHVQHPRIVTITGESASPEVVAQVRAACQGRSTLIVHDGDHRKAGVLRDLEAYCDLVPVGGSLVVEDGLMDLFRPGDGLGLSEEGPLAAIDEFVRTHTEFAVDERRERYLATSNPRGYLRRTR